MGATVQASASIDTFGGLPRRTAGVVVVLMVVAVAGYFLWWGTSPQFEPDTPSYQEVAHDLSDGSLDQLHDRSPGYPLLLLLTGSKTTLQPSLVLLQLAFHLGACWMTLVLAQRFWPPAWITIVLALLLLSPPLTEKAFVGVTEAASEVLVVGATFLFVRWRERSSLWAAVAAGVLIGAAALVRPTYQMLGFIAAFGVAVWLLRQGKKREAFKTAVALAAGSIVLVGAVVVFNFARFDYPGLTPELGWHLSTKTALFVEDLPLDEPARPVLVEARDRALLEGESHTGVIYIWAVRDDVADAVGMERPEIDQYMVGLNLRLIAKNPFGYVKAVANAASNYVSPSASSKADGGSALLELVFGVGSIAIFFGFVAQLFGVVGLYMARRLGARIKGPFNDPAARRVWLVSIAVAVYTAALSVGIEVGSSRHRTPTDPLILLAVTGGLLMSWRAWRGGGITDVGASGRSSSADGDPA